MYLYAFRAIVAASPKRSATLPDVRKRLAGAALEPVTPAPDQFGQLIDAELKRRAPVIKEANVPTE